MGAEYREHRALSTQDFEKRVWRKGVQRMNFRTVFCRCASMPAVVTAALFLGALSSAVPQDHAKAPARPASPNRSIVAGYLRWKRVNPEPVRMQPAAAVQCAAPFPQQLPSPHLSKYITVFVNPSGEKAMFHQKTPSFPDGTVLVKRKLASRDSKSAELLTVMLKRGGEWDYRVYDGAGKSVVAADTDRCRSCHEQSPAKECDHVYRDLYLPDSRKAALR